MGASCKGICKNVYEFSKSPKRDSIHEPKYGNGWKRCSMCELYFKTSEIRCQCCGRVLRLKRANTILGRERRPGAVRIQ